MDTVLCDSIRRFEGLEREEIIKRFASIEFNRFLDYYRDAPDLNISEKSGPRDGERYATGDRFFINIGKMDGVEKGGLLNIPLFLPDWTTELLTQSQQALSSPD